MSDAITRLQQGEREAFREVVELYQAKIRGLLAFMGVPAADVDEVAQDAFIFAYQNLARFEAGTNFEAWLKAIARNKAWSFFEVLKRERRNKRRALEVFLLQQQGDARQADAGDARLERLRLCVERVTGQARTALTRRYSGVALPQIAVELQRSVGAIKVMLMRTRIGLRKCMEAAHE